MNNQAIVDEFAEHIKAKCRAEIAALEQARTDLAQERTKHATTVKAHETRVGQANADAIARGSALDKREEAIAKGEEKWGRLHDDQYRREQGLNAREKSLIAREQRVAAFEAAAANVGGKAA